MATLVSDTQETPTSAAAFTVGSTFFTEAGDRVLMWVGGKYDTTTTPTVSGAGWQLIARWNGGTGATGNDTGTVWLALYAYDCLVDLDMEAPTLTPGVTAPNSWIAYLEWWRPDSGNVWQDALADLDDWAMSASDTSTATPLTGSLTGFPSFPAAGGLSVNAITPTDSILAGTITHTVTSTGMSGGTENKAGNVNNLGADCGQWRYSRYGWTGTGSTSLDVSFSATGASNHSGVIAAVFLREMVGSFPEDIDLTTHVLAEAFAGMSLIVDSTPAPSPPTMSLRILDPDQRRAPTALTVVVGEAYANSLLTFDIDGDAAYTAYADAYGQLDALSIGVPEDTVAGIYTLTVVSVSVDEPDLTASATFTLAHSPAVGHVVGPDADPVEVPDVVREDGSRAWVLQDLMPGGLGSYILTHNPITDDRPDAQRTLNTLRTTGHNGRWHATEGWGRVREWQITGVCFDQAEQEALEAYYALDRRFYVIDDFNEAWIVGMTSCSITPRKRSNLQVRGEAAELTDWLGNYAITFQLHNPDPLEVIAL